MLLKRGAIPQLATARALGGVSPSTWVILRLRSIHVKFHQEIFGVVTLDTGEEIYITEEVLDSMELGYAITLHKAQGSQFPRIIVVVQKGRISDRAWLYTAITRAEAEIHIVGQASDFAAITKSVSNANRRASFLRELLEERKRDSGVG